MRKDLLPAIVGGAFMIVASSADASLLNDQVDISAPGIPGGATSVVVGAGPELIFNDTVGFGAGPDEYISIDIGDSSIQLVLVAQDNFWGWQPGIPDDPFTVSISSLDWPNEIGSTIASISFATSGYFAASLSANIIGPNAIDILVPLTSNGVSCGGTACGTITVQIIPAQVPEPATLALFGLGLAGLGLARRRRAA